MFKLIVQKILYLSFYKLYIHFSNIEQKVKIEVIKNKKKYMQEIKIDIKKIIFNYVY